MALHQQKNVSTKYSLRWISLIELQCGNYRLKMSDRHLWYAACVIKSKCLNFGELVEVVERNKDGPVPFSVALGIISVY